MAISDSAIARLITEALITVPDQQGNVTISAQSNRKAKEFIEKFGSRAKQLFEKAGINLPVPLIQGDKIIFTGEFNRALRNVAPDFVTKERVLSAIAGKELFADRAATARGVAGAIDDTLTRNLDDAVTDLAVRPQGGDLANIPREGVRVSNTPPRSTPRPSPDDLVGGPSNLATVPREGVRVSGGPPRSTPRSAPVEAAAVNRGRALPSPDDIIRRELLGEIDAKTDPGSFTSDPSVDPKTPKGKKPGFFRVTKAGAALGAFDLAAFVALQGAKAIPDLYDKASGNALNRELAASQFGQPKMSDILEQQNFQKTMVENEARLAALDPHTYAELQAGRKLARGDFVIGGGRNRQTLEAALSAMTNGTL